MSLEPAGGHDYPSPANSRRLSPALRVSRRVNDDEILKTDKALRRYGATIERALGSWEVSPQEWADYIAFLSRLLKAVQNHPKDAPLLPHSDIIASKLAQCLNPALPSGVHQKAVEVYSYIFNNFGPEYIASHLHEFMPGLSGILSYASLTVRPGIYTIYEDHLSKLPSTDLRPVLKSCILSLLPALEDETSEDFDRAFHVLETLESRFSPRQDENVHIPDKDGYFWQCFFLAVITSPSRRQGALNFLMQNLPNFSATRLRQPSTISQAQDIPVTELEPKAESVISPEPGLLIRCFACGLADPQVLVQRGFLDLLVSKLPLNSPLLQSRVRVDDLDILVSAASQVLLRREMSLNRRLWSWFLGPDPKVNGDDSNQPSSPNILRNHALDLEASSQLRYFSAYGRKVLERCVLAMFHRKVTSPATRAQPFRICLSLMDRWEIGGSIIPQLFAPALESAYQYSLSASTEDTNEVIRSASLFFDGIEATLIWDNLIKLLHEERTTTIDNDHAGLFAWVVHRFNINDEEMLSIHIPNATLYLLSILADDELSEVSASKTEAFCNIASDLLAMIPERVFTQRAEDFSAVDSSHSKVQKPVDIRNALDAFYGASQQRNTSAHALSGTLASTDMFYHLVLSLILRALLTVSQSLFVQATSLMLRLHSKAAKHVSMKPDSDFVAVMKAMHVMARGERGMTFSAITSMISFIAAFSTSHLSPAFMSRPEVVDLMPALVIQIWQYLSPNLPRHTVEAVKAIWQIQDLTQPDDCLEGSLTTLVNEGLAERHPLECRRTETCRRFAVLWSHTIPPPSSVRRGSLSLTRKGSTLPSVSDARQAVDRQRILTGPLMLVIDILGNSLDPAWSSVRSWICSLPSLQEVLRIHFDDLERLTKTENQIGFTDGEQISRSRATRMRDVEYTLGHILFIIRLTDEWIWQSLGDMPGSNLEDRDAAAAIEMLAESCTRFLQSSGPFLAGIKSKSIEILGILLTSPIATRLRGLGLDSRLMDQLMDILPTNNAELQGPLLNLIDNALKLRVTPEPRETHKDAESKNFLTVNRSTIHAIRTSPNGSSISLAGTHPPPPPPPPQLLNCLKMGFSASGARPHLDQWLAFLSSILPTYADAIFSNVIPLVECLCGELDKLHEDLMLMSKKDGQIQNFAPAPTAVSLLDALEIILARAHKSLTEEQNAEATPKPPAQPRSILGSMASGVFKSESPPTRTAQSNSRLTVILSFQDAIRVCMKLWTWASHSSAIEHFDKSSAATTAYNALKLRNRTRSLLEQMFDNELLESLEVLIFNWCNSASAIQESACLDLLHVVRGMRPKNVVPAILDSICSRANQSLLPSYRQSSQTLELTAVDSATFLLAYLESIEDDAVDEAWSDCMAFSRDVLSNPMPYRQTLPSLLSIVLILAQKIDNTNFGEQRKMRRDLGDVYLRLLGATFTNMPSGYISESAQPDDSQDEEPVSRMDRKPKSLASVLNEAMANLEVILETSDRVLGAINNISGSLLSPIVHAKSFPANVDPEILALFLQVAKKAPSIKSWKKDLLDAFNDPRFLTTPVSRMENDWFPLLRQWCLYDKERISELLSRLSPPSSAGIMFGVGASAARLEADRKTQLNLRRICLLLLSSSEDSFVIHSRTIEEKVVELFEATASSSPSSSIKAELFMLCRALVLSSSAVNIASFWPIINDNLQLALMSLLPSASNTRSLENLSLLQACKLLDFLIVLSPDEFQLHEWLYITDTIDAVYQPSDWSTTALSDQIAEGLNSAGSDDSNGMVPTTPVNDFASGQRRPMIHNTWLTDMEDIKASTKEDFVRAVVQPFLSQLSLHAYEGVYSMDAPDIDMCRRGLLEDLLDVRTMVE